MAFFILLRDLSCMYSFLWKEADLAMTKTLAVSIRGNFTDELPPPKSNNIMGTLTRRLAITGRRTIDRPLHSH